MTQFKYDTLADMGDLSEFAENLGTWPNGHYPALSGTRTSNSTWDGMLAADLARYPERWAEETVTHPVPPLRDDWLGTIIRTWLEAKRLWAVYTDREVLRRFAREQIKKVWPKLERRYRKLLTNLGEPATFGKSTGYTLRKGDAIFAFPNHDMEPVDEYLVNKGLADSLDRAVAEEKAPKGKISPDDPRNDGTLYH